MGIKGFKKNITDLKRVNSGLYFLFNSKNEYITSCLFFPPKNSKKY